MTEFMERVDLALGSEWKTARELAREAGDTGARISANVTRHLRSLERYGLAESRESERRVGSGIHRVTEWRRAA